MHLAGESFRGFFRRDTDCFAAVYIHECSRNFAPVAEFQGTFTQTTSGDDGDRVRGAAVDFDEGDEALSVFPVGVVNAKFLQPEHGKADSKDLAGAEMAVSLRSVKKIFVEGFHGNELSAINSQLNI
jgi:hypothetical protein